MDTSEDVLPELQVSTSDPELQNIFDTELRDFLHVQVSDSFEHSDDGENDDDLEDGENAHEVNDPSSDLDNCGCARKCFEKFTKAAIAQYENHMRKLTKPEKDMVIMAKLSLLGINKNENQEMPNKRKRTNFSHDNIDICQTSFLRINSIGLKYFRNIKKHIIEHGMVPRVHGNTGRIAHNALTEDDKERVVQFIRNYADRYLFELNWLML